ncbi:hypothetical protein OSB04_008781 [Centaurea solstitialis]|uniref:DUF1365 domain-containing protein n=1 Tax=Centaurea solstitialis TaxID=347529 RepID=A0AA38TXY6_9ASTR|nr:hypothetical protein OSB04_008781 [Centaurea solstitialis]
MEVLYLLCSIFSTVVTSFALSLLLLLRRLFSHSAAADDAIALYEGTVWHERRRPVHHSFKYSVRYALIDLDHAIHAPPDHLSPQQARDIAQTDGPVANTQHSVLFKVNNTTFCITYIGMHRLTFAAIWCSFLLTIPPSVGYEQNPLSVYYCYDVDGSTKCLKKCIAEVTNTPWGERVQFLFNPDSDLVAKPLHVSPFMDMLGSWSMRTNAPGENLVLKISVKHPKLGDYFTASLTAQRVSSSSVQHALFFWLMPHKVALWIYWHALKLWWKKVVFIQHPRYGNASYKEDAMERDRSLGCAFAMQTNNHQRVEKISGPDLTSGMNQKDRWFRWRDAKWPWC